MSSAPLRRTPDTGRSPRRMAVIELTRVERPVVLRAVAAYLEAKKPHKGAFAGPTADDILEELRPTPARWAELAAFVIAEAEVTPKR
jgi:hypothetical protein